MASSGERLERMAANDMLDVLHYYFEQEAVVEEDISKARVEMRTQLYGMLYQRAYTWGESRSSSAEFGTQEVGVDPVTGASTEPKLESKPYVPPTPFNPTSSRPYGMAIDPPLG